MLNNMIDTEIDTLYNRIFGNNNPIRSIAVTAASEKEGVTALVLKLAERSMMAGKSTLVVDFNLHNPSIHAVFPTGNDEQVELVEGPGSIALPSIVSSLDEGAVFCGITAPCCKQAVRQLKNPGVIEQYIEGWLKDYDHIFFDTSPLDRVNAKNIPAARVAEACDGTIMVVLAANTTSFMVSAAVEKLGTTTANLLGCVYNDYVNPSLKQELIRETFRLPRWLSKIGRFLRNKIQGSQFLSIQV